MRVTYNELYKRIFGNRELSFVAEDKPIRSIYDVIEELTPARREFAECILELNKRIKENNMKGKAVRKSSDIYELMRAELEGLRVEQFWMLSLNSNGIIIAKKRLSIGAIDCTMADVRLIIREAVLNRATQIAVLHNHPSGNTRPSMHDRRLTDKLKKASELMNIRLIDHLIVTDNSYFSFNDEGLL